MKLRFLGTGTSTGVPQLQCDCAVCRSTDPRDKRLRCSALVTTSTGANILIDCGPDFREQMLRFHRGDIDALVVTHHHYDHVGGTDDLRPYCKQHNPFPVYCQKVVADDFKRRMPYSFREPAYPGVPRFDLHEIKPHDMFEVGGTEITALPVNHYLLEILAFKIGNLGYITDAKHVPQSTIDALCGVETLVINALRHTEHISHMTLEESLAVAKQIGARTTYLTHISHDMGLTADLVPLLPPDVMPAQDGVEVIIPD